MSRTRPRQMARKTGKAQSGQSNRDIEALWDELLSRQPERIKAAYRLLSQPEREAVFDHLGRMTNDEGWQPEQRLSARIALRALETFTN